MHSPSNNLFTIHHRQENANHRRGRVSLRRRHVRHVLRRLCSRGRSQSPGRGEAVDRRRVVELLSGHVVCTLNVFFLITKDSSRLIGSSSWAPKNYKSLRSWVPAGDPDLQGAWMEDYLPAVQWMRENGVPTAKRYDGIMTIGMAAIRQLSKGEGRLTRIFTRHWLPNQNPAPPPIPPATHPE